MSLNSSNIHASTVAHFKAVIMYFLLDIMLSRCKIDVAGVTATFVIFLAKTTPIFVNTFRHISGLGQNTDVYSTSF